MRVQCAYAVCNARAHDVMRQQPFIVRLMPVERYSSRHVRTTTPRLKRIRTNADAMSRAHVMCSLNTCHHAMLETMSSRHVATHKTPPNEIIHYHTT